MPSNVVVMNGTVQVPANPVADLQSTLAQTGLAETGNVAVALDPGFAETKTQTLERPETAIRTKAEQRVEARMKGYEGENCGECGNFTMVRNGTCLKCDTCGSTSGCS